MIYEKSIFIILFFLVNRIVYGYIPGPRVGSQAILFNNRIYFIGGYNFNEGSLSDVFYYDSEAPLSATGLLPWVDLENQVQLPLLIWHSASLGGTNQDSIFIIGGMRSIETSLLVYQFDLKTNAVGPLTIQGTTPPRRRDMNAVNYEGKIYLFSGRISLNETNVYFSNFDILNTITMTWEVGSLVNAPNPRFLYMATLVNGVIYYIGGLKRVSNTVQDYESMGNIYQYDITSNAWSLKIATVGLLPRERAGHTAILVDGKICVYGGVFKTANTAPREAIAFLDTNSLQWSTPQFSNINTPKLDNINMPRVGFHTATLVNKLMFIAFGNITGVTGTTPNNDYYVFDLEKLQWLILTPDGPNSSNTPIAPPNPLAPNSTTTSSISPSASTKPQDQQPSNNTAIIGLSVGLGVVGLLGAIAVFIFFYKRMKKHDAGEEYNDVGIPSENDQSPN